MPSRNMQVFREWLPAPRWNPNRMVSPYVLPACSYSNFPSHPPILRPANQGMSAFKWLRWMQTPKINGYCRLCLRLRAALLYVGFHCLSLHVSAYMAIFKSIGIFIYLRILLRCFFPAAFFYAATQWKPTYNKAARRWKHNLQYTLNITVQQDTKI
jgi:hypothetical protein